MKLLRRINERKGFTFVEMMMVIAILAVILAFAVPGFASYSKRIKLMELDDSARTIFMAAQNRLMSLHTSGADIDFAGSESVKIEDVPDCFTKVKDKDGNLKEYYDYTAEGYYQPDFRYITSKKIKDIADKDHSIIVGLSSGGPTSIEDQLYQNYFIIEYDASTGFVLGVFYTEEEDLLFKEEGDGETLGAAYPSTLSAKREFEDRLDDGGTVGYYGGGTLVNIPKGAEVATPEAEYYDLEKLVFYVKYPDDGSADKYYISFTIWEADESYHKKESTKVEIIPKDENYYVTEGGVATVILDSLAPGQGADNGHWNLDGEKDLTKPRSDNPNGFVLERDFKGWVYRDSSGNPAPDEDLWADNDYPTESSTNNYVIEPGANIIVEITFFDPTDANKSIVQTYGDAGKLPINSYFASLKDGHAGIGAGRHLQNLANYVKSDLVKDAELLNTIDFSNDLSGTGECYRAWNSAETYKGTDKNDRARHLYDFKPIGSQFVDGSKFLNGNNGDDKSGGLIGHYSDKGYMLKYLRINTDPNVHSEYEKLGEDVYNYTGFFARLYNSGASDLCFYCPVVKGCGKYTGVFFGTNTGGSGFNGITVINPIVEGPGYVGGFSGGKTGGGQFENCSLLIQEVDDYFDNYADRFSERGIKGDITWGNPNDDPYSHFYIRGVERTASVAPLNDGDLPEPTTAYAGGLVGGMKGTMTKVSASVHVESVGYAGGIVGYSDDAQFNGGIYAGGHTYHGTFSGTVATDGYDYVLKNISGDLGAGGLVGYAKGGVLINNRTHTTCSVYSKNSDNADVLVGVTSDGKREYGEDSVYTVGYVIDDAGKIIRMRTLSTGKVDTKDGTSDNKVETPESEWVDAEPYDSTLPDKYPYVSAMEPHYGDWPVDPPVMGVFYWEKVGGEYGILGKFYNAKTGKSDEIDTLTTEDAEVTEYGYGYFYTPAVTTASDNMLNGVMGNNCYDRQKLKNITDLRNVVESKTGVMPIIVMYDSNKEKDVHDLVSLSFDYSYKGATGEKTFRFNPDFCGVSADDDAHTIGEEENRYRIRSAVQFSNIKNSLGAAFEQDLSINLVNHYAIGSLKKGAFTGMYNGKGKTIEVHNLFFEAGSDISDGNGIGIFGVTRGAKIEKIEANYSSSNIPDINGESSSRIGVGGIAGIAIGGSIENCKVYNFNVSVTNRYNTAIGGIVGYSSADISNCELCGGKNPGDADNSAISIDNQTGGSAGDVAAAGGIAGSASGTITKCKVNLCSMGDMKAAKIEAEGNAPLVIAGGIVGNNVSFEGKTELTVDSCISHAQLTRPGKNIVENGNTVYDQNVLIHPIAPDIFTINLNNIELYDGYESNPEKDEETYILEKLAQNNIVKQDAESIPIYHVATGTGVKDLNAVHQYNSEDFNVELTVTITNCSAYQGEKHYNSRVCGNSANSSDKVVIHPEEGDNPPTRKPFDVYVFVPPKERSYVKYVKLAPTAGIYSLYEKDGSTIFAKAYFKDEPIDDKPEGNTDPLYRYGVMVTLGRFDEDEVVVTIDKGEPIKAIGQSYLGLNEQAITLSTSDSGNAAAKYFDFSEEIISEPGEHTVTVKFKGEDGNTKTVFNTTINIPKKRPPYVGVYQLMSLNNGTYLDGVYTTESEVKDVRTENCTEIGEYGIMLEHSDVAPHTLGEIEVTLSYKVDEKVVEKVLKPSELVNAGKDAYSGENWVKPQVHGKQFDFYNISKSVLEEIPEYTEITITVRYKDGEKTGKVLASATYTTPLQIPHFGVYGLEKLYYKEVYGGDRQYDAVKYIFKFADDSDDKATAKTEITFFASNLVKREIEGYGILLEKGYDINKVTVKLSGGKKEATIDGKDLEPVKKDYYKGVYKDASDPNLAPFQNDGHLSDNVAYDLYKIDLEDVPESTATIEISYKGAKTEYKMSVDIVNTLKVDVKGHEHKFGEWKNDAENHWHYCTIDDCYEKDENGNNKKLDDKPHVASENWVDDDEAGKSYLYCSVCGYKMKERELLKHDHVLSEEWGKDQSRHWKTCTAKKQYYDEDGTSQEVDCDYIEFYNHTLIYEVINEYQHKASCSICGYSETINHVWEDDPENAKQYKCKCGKTHTKDMPDEDGINNVGIYFIYDNTDNGMGSIAWYSDDAQEKHNMKDGALLRGEIGILINENFKNDIVVRIDDIVIDGATLSKYDGYAVQWNQTNHFGDKCVLTAYAISSDIIKDKEVVDIKIEKKSENSSGGGYC